MSLRSSLKHDEWAKPFLRQYRGALVLALFLGLLAFVLAGALMFDSGFLISRAAERPDSVVAISLPILLARVIGLSRPIVQYAERLTSHNWVLRMTSGLRKKLYGTLEKDAIFLRRTHRTGDILGLLAEDIGYLQNLYLRTIFPTLIAWLLYAVLVIALGFFSLWFALVMALLLGITVFVVPLVSVLVNGARQTKRKLLRNELYAELTDNVLGVSDWIFSGRSEEYLEHHRTLEGSLRKVDAELNRFARIRDLVVQIVFGIIALALLVWSGSYFGGSWGGSGNWIAAFVLCIFPLVDAFAPLSTAATETTIYADSIDRLNKITDKEEVSHEIPESLQGPFTLKVQDVTFSYPDTERLILNGLDLVVPSGQKLAILGRSGAGKSTLAALLRGDLVPTSGQVTLHDIPTDRFGDEIADHIGVIQQQTYLFNMTVLDNLRIGRQTATEEEAWDVLDKVGLKSMVQRLPEGLNTMVDEAGMRFSGGERHRIALARVLLQDTPIVILDEPTVGLDPFTERELLDTFFENLSDKTLIMITHHLQGVSAMDRVIFIENGTIKMDGTPAELEKTDPHYRKLQAFDKGIELP